MENIKDKVRSIGTMENLIKVILKMEILMEMELFFGLIKIKNLQGNIKMVLDKVMVFCIWKMEFLLKEIGKMEKW